MFTNVQAYHAQLQLSAATMVTRVALLLTLLTSQQLLTCSFCYESEVHVNILASEIGKDLFDGSQLVGAYYLNNLGDLYSGKSASYCVRFVSYFLESTKTRGAINRIVTLTKWVDPARKLQELVMGFSARDPGNLGWFGYPREPGSFRYSYTGYQ